MPGHVTDKCHHLCHKIQDLIDSKAILPQPKESSTLSNHHINTSSTIFDPTHYIILAHLPKPIIPIPDESSISVLEFEPTTEQMELKELRKALEEMGQKMDTQMIQIEALTQKMDSLFTFIFSDPNLKRNAKEDMDEGRSPPKMRLSKMFKGLAEASKACNTSKDSGCNGVNLSNPLGKSVGPGSIWILHLQQAQMLTHFQAIAASDLLSYSCSASDVTNGCVVDILGGCCPVLSCYATELNHVLFCYYVCCCCPLLNSVSSVQSAIELS
ncbi:hypothetical protein RHMOL_Rhmol01G0111300 [Rhododendron molle]|uniref:Uncharacterized protein n=1 Tax=Rhododendron molle TaxID=49168 RepID=A0ACC0Q3I6_RHOML|nr:hypothetical protein RHMOL_Rhmol01G0111300 [Rhododendron molle]